MEKIYEKTFEISKWSPYDPHIDDIRKELLDEINHHIPAKSVINIIEESETKPGEFDGTDYTLRLKVYYRG